MSVAKLGMIIIDIHDNVARVLMSYTVRLKVNEVATFLATLFGCLYQKSLTNIMLSKHYKYKLV